MLEDKASASLISRARLGDQSELGMLLDSFRPFLTRLARQHIGPKLQVRFSGSDLVQDTLLTASQGFESFRGETEDELRNWLLQIFRSRLNDSLRKHLVAERRKMGLQDAGSCTLQADSADSPSTEAMHNERAARLLAVMSELNQLDREILLLRYTEQLAFEQIAERVSLPLSNVWRRWSRSVEILRKRLAE